MASITACTRKQFRAPAYWPLQAILAAGGLIHRADVRNHILFANHRHFLHDNQDWSGAINHYVATREK